MPNKNVAKIRWAAPLRPELLKRLYDSDAVGIQDSELCEEVAIALYVRCGTFALVCRGEVECPVCGAAFRVSPEGESSCPRDGCGWRTIWPAYAQSLKDYNAHTGRAVSAYLRFHRAYPSAKTYREKMLLIDQLIHSFHVNEKTGLPVKSVASKLLEGNKKAVVRFLDELSALRPEDKKKWRRSMEMTIDKRIVRRASRRKDNPGVEADRDA